MKIVHDWDELSRPPQRTVLTIGNFDGVHLGHRTVFRQVVEKARQLDGTAAVYTFCPHPLKVLSPQHAPRLINTLAEKEQLIEASQIDLLVCPPFTRKSASQTAQEFVDEVLVKRLRIAHLVVGADYAFGQNRSGDVAFLQKMGTIHGFTVEPVCPVRDSEAVYSSTRVRQLVEAGAVAECVAILGRQFTLQGSVVHGDKRGRQLGFPTANLKTEKELLPASGVYAVKARVNGQVYDAVANIGRKPTYGGQAAGIEVHLMNYSGDLYGQQIRIFFVDRLRSERRFGSSQELSCAIAEDIKRARPLLAQQELIEYRADVVNSELQKDV